MKQIYKVIVFTYTYLFYAYSISIIKGAKRCWNLKKTPETLSFGNIRINFYEI